MKTVQNQNQQTAISMLLERSTVSKISQPHRINRTISPKTGLIFAYIARHWPNLHSNLTEGQLKQLMLDWEVALTNFCQKVIEAAINKVPILGKPFAPTLPEFYSICANLQPEDFGLPSTKSAYLECQNAFWGQVTHGEEWSHPVVGLTFHRFAKSWGLARTESFSDVFKRAYSEVMLDWIRGKIEDSPPPKILMLSTHTKHEIDSQHREYGKQQTAKLKAKFCNQVKFAVGNES